jgi:AI-2 transport protein TqsA
MTSAVSRNALVIIAVILSGAAIRWLGPIVTPLLLAVFLAVLVDGLAALTRRWIPRLGIVASTALALAITLSLFVAGVAIVAANAKGFVASLAGAAPKITTLLDAVSRAAPFLGPDAVKHLTSEIPISRIVSGAADLVRGVGETSLLVLIYLGFLIASRRALVRKGARVFRTDDGRRQAVAIINRVRSGVEQYLWVQAIVGLIIAGISWALMSALGLANAGFWAFIIFVSSFAPYVGALVGIGLPVIFALLQFAEPWRAGALLVGFWLTHTIVGSVVLPRMQGDRLNLDPLIILLSLAFWGSIWGVEGVFLSTPLTVTIMAILAQFPGSRRIAIMMSSDGAPFGLSLEEPAP